jgi:hypothetical protein
VEGRFLQADDVAGLRAQAARAQEAGAGAIFLGEGPLGDPIVLAAGLSPSVPDVLLGARLALAPDGRHPAMLARELTSLDLVCGGRSVLCFTPPFDDRLAEAIALCHALNLPLPAGAGSPLIALDLTGGDELPGLLAGAADLLLHPTDDAAVCRVERT